MRTILPPVSPHSAQDAAPVGCDDRKMERNVLGGPLAECGTSPLTGYYRTGSCVPSAGQLGGHSICVVVTEEFLEHQKQVGNDLTLARPDMGLPGLQPGMRWCVLAPRWLQSFRAGT